MAGICNFCKNLIPATDTFYKDPKNVYDISQCFVFITGKACVVCKAQAEVRDKITLETTDCETPCSRYSDVYEISIIIDCKYVATHG